MTKYGEAFKRPFTDVVKLLIGILLSIVPIVNFISSGYQLECAKTANKNKFKLPDWKNWGNLFVRGLLAMIIGIIYMLPALILFTIGIGTAFLTGFFTEDVFSMIATSGPVILSGLVLLIIAAYISPMALTNYAMTYKFSAGFDFKKIFKKSFTGKYSLAWLFVIIYAFIVSYILGFIPYVGSAIASFILGVTMLTLFGSIYSKV
ncbi:MAG: DUF4013 domain-containing protein [Nanoarchaeota archaeon]|nr:DUF4013 domain-containing protein [Nanoarchaeota archaeon]MBU1445193.1 DUF4013 domain-containing protein [Nanoarchaeota archaeon]MBU2406932.1 DUF4013 domain-containing protein [Nanoarchaeota archaeon]MBU2420856.1 DUF4013 domain-containing protein [Nanoarchaeota archaeon]MBU2475327.1 DUF4013 domain-containing protein [Nanoarchaeota archaeon]